MICVIPKAPASGAFCIGCLHGTCNISRRWPFQSRARGYPDGGAGRTPLPAVREAAWFVGVAGLDRRHHLDKPCGRLPGVAQRQALTAQVQSMGQPVRSSQPMPSTMPARFRWSVPVAAESVAVRHHGGRTGSALQRPSSSWTSSAVDPHRSRHHLGVGEVQTLVRSGRERRAMEERHTEAVPHRVAGSRHIGHHRAVAGPRAGG